MIPDYLTFIRYQDKRLLPFLYLILFFFLGLYWRNNGYAINAEDAGFLSAITAVILFNVIYELEAYWMYKGVTKNVDLSYFIGKSCGVMEKRLARPPAVAILALAALWLILSYSLRLPLTTPALVALSAMLPLLVYLVFRWLRSSYIRQLGITTQHQRQYRTLYHYIACSFVLNMALTLLTIHPLKRNPDFSAAQGWLTPTLVVATFILCATVLAINLLFTRLSKRYVFLGKLFLNEIDFSFSTGIPCAKFHETSLAFRLLLVLSIQFVWIVLVNLLLLLLAWPLPFAVYFLICFLPGALYYLLHLYWCWHTDYLAACDMYFRWNEIDKRSQLW
ncbi:hypothetical protein ACFSFZ_12935 [Mixta tenebrionis]|uniref:Uncharacterized protein n=1 Tax=Mixta tenebrionis TaxID=2562439 RepID=A0A506VGF5_9GAMM|nr:MULTISPECIES: hypothetical protein [Mixta]QHM75964.1 hypothetical protein C7M52_01924 [Mixta theicola]TPW44486.1 hypothetical protein FKM52_01895 [Mixta tenebrionis]